VATIRFWAETFESKPPNIEALRIHITSLLLNGLQLEASARSVQRTRNK
jgi:hypothetical protein